MKKLDKEVILDILMQRLEGTLDENISSSNKLINILSELLEAVGEAKVKVPSWMFHIQTLIAKLIYTSHSILNLSKGYEYGFYNRLDKVTITDYSSMFILTRALIENYVILCYIYNNNLSDEEKLFRFKLWEVSGLISRQNLGDNNMQEIIKKKNEEKLLIDKIMSEIKKIPEYQSLDKGKLNKLQKHGLPRLYNWHELIDMSDLRKDIFSLTYSFFSSYAHSEYLSILQLRQASLNSQDESNIRNVKLNLEILRMIISMTIDFYVRNFKSAEIFFNTLPFELRYEVNIWLKTSKKYD